MIVRVDSVDVTWYHVLATTELPGLIFRGKVSMIVQLQRDVSFRRSNERIS